MENVRQIEMDDTGVTVSAETLARHFNLDAAEVPKLLRQGAITGFVEQGANEDEGRFRISLQYAGRRLRLTFDRAGNILNVGRTVLLNRQRLLP